MVKNTRKKILIISHDKIGSNMAGPGIRYHHMAEFLSKDFEVTVGFFNPDYLPDDTFSCTYLTTHVDAGSFHEKFQEADAIVAMWLSEEMMRFCREHNIYMAFDMYAPVPVENLSLFMYSGDTVTSNTEYIYRQSYSSFEKFFEYGDLFLLSNKRQFDFWMGYAFGTGIISVGNYIKRPIFERFIFAPMGVDTTQRLSHTKKVIKGAMNGIGDEDKVILWTGGIWNWFDAQSVIRAMRLLKDTNPEIKLVFFGTKHPNPEVPAMKEAATALSLAKKLGVYNTNVFLYDGWVPYGERINYLLEADAAINTVKDTIETELSHRTRVLDHLLTLLPTISTKGDYLSDEVIEPRGLGITVQPAHIEEIKQAILDVLDEKNNQQMRENIKKVRSEFDWTESLDSLRTNLLQMNKLPYVEIVKPRELAKDSIAYRIGRKVLPLPVKKIVIKALRYGK